MAFKVFISYSTKDLPIVQQVKSLLQSSAVEVFVAEYSVAPGQSLPAEIINAIKSCNLFVLLRSENSKASEWVPQEIGIAAAEKKTIIPVVLSSGMGLPGFIQDRKYLAAHKNPERHLVGSKPMFLSRLRSKRRLTELFGLG